jgi:CheY-like chemotaxis protein
VLDYLNQFKPDAITLDINMPDINGWKVLDRLKNDLKFRHIAIYVISGEEDKSIGLKRGARNCLVKPLKDKDLKNLFTDIIHFTDKKVKDVLLLSSGDEETAEILKVIEGSDVNIVKAKTVKELKEEAQKREFDCFVLNASAQEKIKPEELRILSNGNGHPKIPSIVYAPKNLSKKEETQYKQLATSVISKDNNSLRRLTDKVALFLHREHANLPELVKNEIEQFNFSMDILQGKNVLIVDDDVRNLFALTTALERFKLNVLNAESGKEAISILQNKNDIDIVLMDIMMPDMDGYATMKEIRKDKKNDDITIIAVTAKAMKGDRQKCIESGASDYITKPVNIDQLVPLMRVWVK